MDAVFNALCDSTVKGALVLGAAYLATSLLHGRSAALRHALWAAALACLLVIPLITVLSPPVQLPILPAHSSDAVSIEIVSQINATDTIDVPEPLQQRPSAPVDRPDIASQHPVEAAHPSSAFTASASVPRGTAVPVVVMTSKKNSLSWKDWAAVIWLAIAAIALARLCIGQILLALRARRATIIADGVLSSLLVGVCERVGVHRPVRLVCGSEPMPMTWGIWRPTVLLPIDAERWTPKKQLIVLLHEAGHIKRFDCLWQMIGQVAAAVFWINPLTWLAVLKLRAEAERACDDLVLSTGQRPSAYAEQLLEIVRAAQRRHRGLANFGAVAMARPSRLQARVRAILDLRHRRTKVTRRFVGLVSVAALVLVLPLAVVRLSVRSIAQTASAPSALSQNAGPVPSSRPATQSDSVWDGFVSIQWNRSNDGGVIPVAVHAGLLEADGRMNVRVLKSNQFLPGIISRGVRSGEVFLEHIGSDIASDLAMNLRTGQIREIGKVEKVVPDLPWISLKEMLQWRGDLHVLWRITGFNASGPTLLGLNIENKKMGTVDKIVDGIRYSEPPSDAEPNQPPTVWLDDNHLLTIRDDKVDLNDFRGSTYRAIVIDIRAKSVREIGTVPWGIPVDDVVEPLGPNGDAAILADGKTFAISAADAINGRGRLEQRPMKWGAFTLSGARDFSDGRFGQGGDASIHADTLDLDDKPLGTDVEVCVSPDGKRVIWREKQFPGNNDGEVLYYCDSATKVVQRIASADSLIMPVWATRQQMTGSVIPASDATATTKSSAEMLSIVADLSNDSFAIRQAATEKLVGMGMDIEPQLQELLKGSSLTEEARLRVNEVISRLFTAPSKITLHYNDAPMMAVLEDFARQSRADLGIHRPQIADYAKSRRLSINVDHVSFWARCRKSNCRAIYE
jgi:beta-lactamase regulating signal transducer with metallopeptidase domain